MQIVESLPRWTAPSPENLGCTVARRGTPGPPALILHFVGRMTLMFWELVLAVLAGWTVLPALVWALANEIIRLI